MSARSDSETPGTIYPSANPAIAVEDQDESTGCLDDDPRTTSLRSSMLDYPIEYGRQYHAFKEGRYHRPNDEEELERLDIINEMFSLINDGKLHRAPIGLAPQRILDIGAGSGIWAIEMGDLYPNTEITGVEISPTVPEQVPPNVKFEIDDVEDDWTYDSPFDYIHSRYMAGAIKDWPKLIHQSYQHLAPGGWAEFADLQVQYYSQDDTLTKETALHRWSTVSAREMERLGVTLRPGVRLETWMRTAGFVNIQVERFPIPVGSWPKDKKLKRIGTFNFLQLWDGIQGMSLRLFLGKLGWTRERLEVFLMEVRNDLTDSRLHSMYDMYTVWGQKP